MDSETNLDSLQSTLDELAHLLIDPSRLTIVNEQELGTGGYGEVCLATLDGSSKVAVKQLRIILAKGTRVRVAMRLARELKVWARAKHPNILELVGYYLSDNYGCAQLISPYMANGNVTEYMKRTQADTQVRLGFALDITSGMEYLHSCEPPICHGDLKPANVLINDEPNAVLCDFGLASFVQESGASSGLTTSRSVKGSTRYMSPELFQESEGKHTLESDVWAWACTVFEILTDCLPYSTAIGDGGVMLGLVRGDSPGSVELLTSLLPNIDTSLRATLNALQILIPGCWDSDPHKRPSLSTISDRLHDVDPLRSEVPPESSPQDERADKQQGMPEIIKPSSKSRDQSELSADRRTIRISFSADGEVIEKTLEIKRIVSFSGLGAAKTIAFSPNGKFIAIVWNDKRSYSWLWNSEDESTEELRFPPGYGDLRWSRDSGCLAWFGSEGLYLWLARSGSSRLYLNERIDSVAWFSDGKDMAIRSGQRISVWGFNMGEFNMKSNWRIVHFKFDAEDMATVPMDRVGGRRIAVIVGSISELKNRTEAHGWLLKRVMVSIWRTPPNDANIIVYDTDARKTAARGFTSGNPRCITISKNGEFMLVSSSDLELWRLAMPNSGKGTCHIQLIHAFSCGLWISVDAKNLGQACFGGNNDEWVIVATRDNKICIWDTQVPNLPEVVPGLRPGVGPSMSEVRPYTPHTAFYSSESEGSSDPLLFCGSDNGEVVIWKWWKRSSK